MKKLIEKCNRLGIYCFGCFMIGFPEETPEQIRQTKDFILAPGLDYAKVSITQPLVGSELYDVYNRLGLRKGVDERASTYFHTKYDTVHFKAEELNEMRGELLRAFARQRIRNIFRPGGLSAMYCRSSGRWRISVFSQGGMARLEGLLSQTTYGSQHLTVWTTSHLGTVDGKEVSLSRAVQRVQAVQPSVSVLLCDLL